MSPLDRGADVLSGLPIYDSRNFMSPLDNICRQNKSGIYDSRNFMSPLDEMIKESDPVIYDSRNFMSPLDLAAASSYLCDLR